MASLEITSAQFMRGVSGTDEILSNGTPQIALIGRSNVGKSSLINSLTGQKNLARTSDTPGLTKEINVYCLNHVLYLLDLPGYGFAKVPEKVRAHIQKMNWWYLFESPYEQKVNLLVVDANVGPSQNDREMLSLLLEHQKNIIIVANKIDKIKKQDYETRLQAVHDFAHGLRVIPYSSHKNIGQAELLKTILE